MGKAFKINVRAFKLLYERYPQMMLSRLFTEIWNSLTPYVGIYLSALIIGELAGCRDAERLLSELAPRCFPGG